MNPEIAANLTQAQRGLLQELENAFPAALMVGRPSPRSLRVAHALERLELVFTETDELGFSYAWLNPQYYPHPVPDAPCGTADDAS